MLNLTGFAFSSPMRRSFSLVIGALVLTSCAGAKSATTDELRSDLRSAISLASETNLLIDQIERNRLPREFRTAQADYLRGEALRQAREARSSEDKSNDAKTFDLCAEQLEQLARQVTFISAPSGDETLAQTRRRVEIIRKTLIAAGTRR